MISLTNHDFQWGRSEVVIIYPDIMWAVKKTPTPSHEILGGWKRYPNPMAYHPQKKSASVSSKKIANQASFFSYSISFYISIVDVKQQNYRFYRSL